MLKLTCRDELGNPVYAAIELTGSDGTREHVQTDSAGIASAFGTYTSATIRPVDGHWNVLIGPLNQEACIDVLCPALEGEEAFFWWRSLLCPDRLDARRGAGVRIGVVDIPFQPDEFLNHIQFFDVEGNPLDCDGLPAFSHGYRVCKTISERGATALRTGLACNAELVFVDVSDDNSRSFWDFDKIAPAIDLLVEKFNVDFINISGGTFAKSSTDRDEISQFFEEYIEYARNGGVLIFAAVGNDAKAGVALPAGLNTVIGVGAIGQCDIAPSGTLMATYEQVARSVAGSIGKVPSGASIFHYLDSGFGEGLNLVGPGIGMFMEMDGGIVAEYEGTSYACPSVIAAVSGSLAKEIARRPEHGPERHNFLTQLARSICVDLGIDRARQGWGLPIHK